MKTTQLLQDQAAMYNKSFVMKTILILSILLFTHTIFAAVSETATIEGVIVKYDKKTVTLLQNGKKIKVPRKSIPPHFRIRGGNKVYAVVNAAMILKKMKQQKAKKRAPASIKKIKKRASQ